MSATRSAGDQRDHVRHDPTRERGEGEEWEVRGVGAQGRSHISLQFKNVCLLMSDSLNLATGTVMNWFYLSCGD